MSPVSAPNFWIIFVSAEERTMAVPSHNTIGEYVAWPFLYMYRYTVIMTRAMPAICRKERLSLNNIIPTTTVTRRLNVVVVGKRLLVSTCVNAYICSSVSTAYVCVDACG